MRAPVICVGKFAADEPLRSIFDICPPHLETLPTMLSGKKPTAACAQKLLVKKSVLWAKGGRRGGGERNEKGGGESEGEKCCGLKL